MNADKISRTITAEIPPEFHWIARDENGQVWVYVGEPMRWGEYWFADSCRGGMRIYGVTHLPDLPWYETKRELEDPA